jgi:hypothetical protein
MTNDEWIDGPLQSNIGVIWLGEAASKLTENRLKPGIHRVVYPHQSKCRLTIWYELCTIEQLTNISVDKKDEVMVGGTVTFKNLFGLPPITVLPGENKLEFLRRIEAAHGLSMSKTGSPHYTLKKHDISYPTITNVSWLENEKEGSTISFENIFNFTENIEYGEEWEDIIHFHEN